MKKIIAILLAAVLIICTASIGFISVVAEDSTLPEVEDNHPAGYYDLTDIVIHGTSTFWRVFAQIWVEIYFFFVDMFNGFPVG